SGGTFAPLPASPPPGSGIGGFDLADGRAPGMESEYDSGGKVDQLVLYRPGTGNFWILKNSGGTFAPVPASPPPGSGIGGFDLADSRDRAFAFDYDSSGKVDHLVLYRPGTGNFWILKNSGGTFAPVPASPPPGSGIGGFDL